ncbi:hypothetical protein LTR62_005917 [Meristemomyces frigidus]|uniref:Uncharacterized protein n=1 Tax=Meristemomyces frigidus TaxID=1508187 RepID=A0AAN7TIQ6_9PEZI|nr:hypothetical protein LTR62_005917 [Meristemomyces frigidus]
MRRPLPILLLLPLLLLLTTLSFLPRASSTLASPMIAPLSPYSFPLNPALFNQTLYSALRPLWFADIPPDAVAPPAAHMKKWFGLCSAAEKRDLDERCGGVAGPALRSIGPELLASARLPTGHGDERARAERIPLPFLLELESTMERGGRGGGGGLTLLSLVLLLDQMPRNLYPLALRVAVGGVLVRSPGLFTLPGLSRRLYWMWFLLPLMHAEDLASQHQLWELSGEWSRLSREEEEEVEGLKEMRREWAEAYREHVFPLERFARYPHRNLCLGRESTGEEEGFLRTAGTFGVEQERPGEGGGGEG